LGGEWIVKPFELYISYVSWGGDGKYRPVLVFSLKDETVFVYSVTSQFESKSEAIRARYFKINDWMQVGLDKQSYVDTGIYFPVPVSALKDKAPIGELTAEDKQKLLDFITKKM
jgi:hypothetical protein